MLRLSKAQKEKILELSSDDLVSEVMEFVKSEAPDTLLTDAEMYSLCKSSLQKGRALGLRKKYSVLLFAFLAHETGGESLKSREIAIAISESGRDPDVAMDQILNVAEIVGEL